MDHNKDSGKLDEDAFRKALRIAIREVDITAVRDLLGRQLRPSPSIELRETYSNALTIAADSNDTSSAIRIHKEWLADPSLPPLGDGDYHLSMAGAIKQGNRDLIQYFLRNGARMTIHLHGSLLAPLDYSPQIFDAILQDFLDAGWKFDDSDILKSAAIHRNEHLFTWLLNHGANPQKRGRRSSPVSSAARYLSLAAMNLLFSHGASIDHNALPACARRGVEDAERISIMHLLLSHGGHIDHLETGVFKPSSSSYLAHYPPRNSALHEAVLGHDVEMVEFLMKMGADPHLKMKSGNLERRTAWEIMIISKRERLKAVGKGIRAEMDNVGGGMVVP